MAMDVCGKQKTRRSGCLASCGLGELGGLGYVLLNGWLINGVDIIVYGSFT
jgi:hypothetical protein